MGVLQAAAAWALLACPLALAQLAPAPLSTAAATPTVRNSSTLPLASYTLVIEPWENHYQYPAISVPVGTKLTFLWTNDDHGVYLVRSDQCPSTYQPGTDGQEELYPVTSKTAGTSNYTTPLNHAGVYYFVCQEGTHCIQGQNLQVTVYNYTEAAPGTPSLAQYPGSAGLAPQPSLPSAASGRRSLA
eukprot:jgi/Astpho2/7898/fgenesh1_pg.00118_%23_13_t